MFTIATKGPPCLCNAMPLLEVEVAGSKVKLKDQLGRVVRLGGDAAGATAGKDLRWPGGCVVNPSGIRNPSTDSDSTGGLEAHSRDPGEHPEAGLAIRPWPRPSWPMPGRSLTEDGARRLWAPDRHRWRHN